MIDTFYVCDRCGHGFQLEEGKRVYMDGEAWTACPNCGSQDLEEGKKCKMCGEIVYPWNIRSGVCPYCFTECVKTYRQKLDELDDSVREVLEDFYGELDITKR